VNRDSPRRVRSVSRDEILQLVDRTGRPTGRVPRSACHGDPELIQAVVHLHLFDTSGRMYLQKRALSKDLYPGRWDTGVGGHMAPGENPEQALRREAREELGIELGDSLGTGALERLEPYVYSDDMETEYVFPFRLVFSGTPRPNPEEVADGSFFTSEEIRDRLRESPEDFTPHFRFSFEKLLDSG